MDPFSIDNFFLNESFEYYTVAEEEPPQTFSTQSAPVDSSALSNTNLPTNYLSINPESVKSLKSYMVEYLNERIDFEWDFLDKVNFCFSLYKSNSSLADKNFTDDYKNELLNDIKKYTNNFDNRITSIKNSNKAKIDPLSADIKIAYFYTIRACFKMLTVTFYNVIYKQKFTKQKNDTTTTKINDMYVAFAKLPGYEHFTDIPNYNLFNIKISILKGIFSGQIIDQNFSYDFDLAGLMIKMYNPGWIIIKSFKVSMSQKIAPSKQTQKQQTFKLSFKKVDRKKKPEDRPPGQSPKQRQEELEQAQQKVIASTNSKDRKRKQTESRLDQPPTKISKSQHQETVQQTSKALFEQEIQQIQFQQMLQPQLQQVIPQQNYNYRDQERMYYQQQLIQQQRMSLHQNNYSL